MQSQVGLRKHHYEQSWWKWWNTNWAISNPNQWCCESAALNMPANLENSAEATGLEMVSFLSNPKERQCQKMFNYHTIALISHTSKVMLKILQTRLQQYMNREFPDIQSGFRKGRGTRDQISSIHWIIKKVRECRKTSTSALLIMPKPWLCRSQQTVENSERDGNTRPLDLPLEKSVCRSGSNSWNWPWNNGLVPNRKRSTSRLYTVTVFI